MAAASSATKHSATRLRRVVLVLARRLRPALQSQGLSTAKLSVIGQLHRVGPMTPTELAEREGVKLATLTRLLAELAEDGWLGRETDAADGRRSILSLKPDGRKRLIASAQLADATLSAAIETVATAEELAMLRQACDLLERISDAVGAMGGTAEDKPGGQIRRPRSSSRAASAAGRKSA